MITALLLGAAPLALPGVAQAQNAFPHPDYPSAVRELRDARWLLEHRVGGPLEDRDRRAMWETDRALEDVERAAHLDGRFLYEFPRDDVFPGPARLRRVSELLRTARATLERPEYLADLQEAQMRAIGHVDNAIRLTEEVMVERERFEHERMEHERMEHERMERERMEHEHMEHEHMRDHDDRDRDRDRDDDRR
jgi:hypothetical protein